MAIEGNNTREPMCKNGQKRSGCGETLFRLFQKGLNVVSKGATIVCMTSVFALLVVIGYSVWGRYVLNDPPTWAENSALFYLLVIAFIGGGLVVREQGHLRVVFIVNACSPAWRRWIEFAAVMTILIFGIAMVIGGVQTAVQVWDVMDPMLPISRGSYYIPIAISGALIVLFQLERLILLIGSWNEASASLDRSAANL
jgi:TRAP-type C4-dicarboxylate transport system permease small subunit